MALAELAMPVLVAVGEHDVPGFREMSAVLARGIPAAQYHVVADAGHMINMEQPGAVNALLSRFLEQLGPAASTSAAAGQAAGQATGPAGQPAGQGE
jgi:hypothetical protein